MTGYLHGRERFGEPEYPEHKRAITAEQAQKVALAIEHYREFAAFKVSRQRFERAVDKGDEDVQQRSALDVSFTHEGVEYAYSGVAARTTGRTVYTCIFQAGDIRTSRSIWPFARLELLYAKERS